MSGWSGWNGLDTEQGTYFAVCIGEDYSIQPDAIFASRESADAWVAWRQSLPEDHAEHVSVSAEVFTLPVRNLRGDAWNSFDPLPEDGP